MSSSGYSFRVLHLVDHRLDLAVDEVAHGAHQKLLFVDHFDVHVGFLHRQPVNFVGTGRRC